MIKTLRTHKTEIIEAGGKDLYKLFVGAVIALYVVIFATMVLLFAVRSDASETGKTGGRSDKDIIREYVRKTYGKQYKISVNRAENIPDKVLEHRKGKKIVYIDKYITKSFGKYGKVTTKGVFHGRKINYAKSIRKGEKVIVYLVYNPSSNSTDDIVAIINNGYILK